MLPPSSSDAEAPLLAGGGYHPPSRSNSLDVAAHRCSTGPAHSPACQSPLLPESPLLLTTAPPSFQERVVGIGRILPSALGVVASISEAEELPPALLQDDAASALLPSPPHLLDGLSALPSIGQMFRMLRRGP